MTRLESYLKKVEENGNSTTTISTSLEKLLDMFNNDIEAADAAAKEHGYSVSVWDGNDTTMVTLSKSHVNEELKAKALEKWGKRMPQAVKAADGSNPFTV